MCVVVRWGGVYFIMFAFDLLYIKEFRRAWMCGFLLCRQIKSWRNQIRNENSSPSVSIWLVNFARQGLKEKTLKSKKSCFPLFLTGHVSATFLAWTRDF